MSYISITIHIFSLHVIKFKSHVDFPYDPIWSFFHLLKGVWGLMAEHAILRRCIPGALKLPYKASTFGADTSRRI